MRSILLAMSGLQLPITPEISAYDLYSPRFQQEMLIYQSDFYADDSYQKILDDNYGFLDPRYVPADLAPIVSDFTSNDSRRFQLRAVAGEAFADMAWHFQDHFAGKKRLSIVSAYRSYDYQKRLASNCSQTACARAGHSEHQAGLALDLGINGGGMGSVQGESYQWLRENAHLRGFHNTYQKGVSIDGKIIEPRHWRYLGVPLATELKEAEQTLRERYQINIQSLENH